MFVPESRSKCPQSIPRQFDFSIYRRSKAVKERYVSKAIKSRGRRAVEWTRDSGDRIYSSSTSISEGNKQQPEHDQPRTAKTKLMPIRNV